MRKARGWTKGWGTALEGEGRWIQGNDYSDSKQIITSTRLNSHLEQAFKKGVGQDQHALPVSVGLARPGVTCVLSCFPSLLETRGWLAGWPA